jgi:Scramblase
MCCDAEFLVYYAGEGDPRAGELAGKITKQFQIAEMVTDQTNFGLEFDKKLPSEIKAVLLAAVLAIDFSFFEDAGTKGNGMLNEAGAHDGGKKKGGLSCDCCTGCTGLTYGIIGLAFLIGFIFLCVFINQKWKKHEEEFDKG